MPSITNRSRYVVSVKNSPDLTQEFAFVHLRAARSYLQDLKARGYTSACLTQKDDALVVRFRDRGFKAFTLQAGSYEEANQLVNKIAGERHRGLDVDYARGQQITLAELMDQYIEEKCPRHKGRKVEIYTLNAFLSDGGYVSRHARRQSEERGTRRRPRRTRRDRRTRTHIEWLLKPLAQVTAREIEGYIYSSINQGVAKATVDRELDLLSQVINWATKTLGVHLHTNPMVGVERPRYNNERDVRLTCEQQRQLLESAREEDRQYSQELALQPLLAPVRVQARQISGSLSTRKRFIASAREALRRTLGDNFPLIPLYETLIQFFLATAARRSEALALTWANTNLEGKTAFFPDTKNGKSRTVPLRAHLVELLKRLPHPHERVFPISEDAWKGGWERIRERCGLTGFLGHDMRHEAISQIAEAGHASGMPFDVVTLASITGHRDLRMLARYMHLCAGLLADRLDEAFQAARDSGHLRKGRVIPNLPSEATILRPHASGHRTRSHNPPESPRCGTSATHPMSPGPEPLPAAVRKPKNKLNS